jgi:uncharacterized FAD-dependent dehydrogenase
MKSDYNSEVCIVGLGPAGIGAALTLSGSNLASGVLCIDAGLPLSVRSCSVLQNNSCKKEEPCQMISGFGGCSLLGGAKISAFPAGSKLATILGSKDLAESKLSEALARLGNYLPLQKPNITQDDIRNATELFEKSGFEFRYYDVYFYRHQELWKAYQRIFSDLNSSGISLLLNTKLIKIVPEGSSFKLMAKTGHQPINILTKYLVLGVGRLGRRMLKYLNEEFKWGGKENHLDVGVRLEFPTDVWSDVAKYHKDLKLLFDDARTFCVCKDGKVAPYLLEDVYFTDGYCDPGFRSGFTNLGILVRLKPSTRNKTTFNKIKNNIIRLSEGKPICQRLSEYLNVVINEHDSDTPLESSISFWEKGNVNQCFPRLESVKIREAVFYFASRLLPKDHWGRINVFAPEVDYGGLAFPVKPDFSISSRIYLIGDCTGRFRGILQAFCSGILSAESIICCDYEKKR